MALIYADDFQQLDNNYVKTSGSVDSTTLAQQVITGIESLGFYRPMYGYNTYDIGSPSYYSAVCYSTSTKTLVVQTRSGRTGYFGVDTNTNGLKRDITVKGDTLFFSMRWLSVNTMVRQSAGEPLLKFNGLYSVGFSSTGTLVVNDVDTGYSVIYDTDVNVIMEVILGPDYMEVWIGETQVTRVARDSIPITNFCVGFERYRGGPTATTTSISIQSIIVADNSAGSINSRIGRRQAISVPAETVSSQASFEALAGVTAVTALKIPVQDAGANTGVLVGGNLFSTTPFTKTTLNATLPTGKIIAACVHVQAKKRNPTNDGVVVVPWISAGGMIYTASYRPEIRARWKGWCTPIEIPEISTSSLTFGYTHDYPAGGAVFVDDRAKVEIYGEPAVSLPVLPYQSKVPTNSIQITQNTTYSAYAFNYAKSDIGLTKVDVNNLTYLQEQ